VLARAMGAPIGPVVLCLNANRVLLEFLEQGEYLPRPSVATIANAMDVGAPSNLERLRWLFPDPAASGGALEARSYDDDAIRAAIVAAHARYGVVACPHTATALAELMRRRDSGDARPWVAVATAHPSKFDTVVEPLIGHAVAVPDALRATLARPSRRRVLDADYDAFVRALGEPGPSPD
jgi:threonine synthase